MQQSIPITPIFLFCLTFFGSISTAQNNLQGINDMNKQIINNFANAINKHNVDEICSLMTEDHKFIDSQGNEVPQRRNPVRAS